MTKILTGHFIPASSGNAKQLIVLLHGYSGHSKSMDFLAREWAKQLPDAAFLLPQAPDPCATAPDKGFQWFATRASSADKDTRRNEIAQVTPLLNDLIDDHLKQLNLTDKNLFIAGFSQGAMMAMHAAPRRKNACAGVIAYSGMLIDPKGLQAANIVKMPILAIHGGRDAAVPPEHLDGVRDGFTAAGFPVETTLNPRLGHVIERAGVEKGLEFIERHIQPIPATPKPKSPKPPSP